MKPIIKIIVGILLLPFLIGSAISFVKLLHIFSDLSTHELFFLGGFFSYFLFEIVFSRPIRTYVLGHELSHVLASLICGGLPKKIKISKKGGSVSLTKTNFFISLSPYILPIYTGFIIGVYFICKYFFEMQPFHQYFMMLTGFSLAFHLRLTLFAIRQGQPDLKMTGVFFSLIFIVLVNFIVLAFLLRFLFPGKIYISDYLGNTWEMARGIYIWVYDTAVIVFDKLIEELV